MGDFSAQLERFHGSDAADLIAQLRAGKVAGGSGPWAGFAIGTRDDGEWVWIGLRNLWTRAPRLRVWYYEYPDSHAKHKNRHAHARIEREHGFARYDTVSWLRDEPVPALAARDVESLRREVVERLSVLVTAGLFGVAVRRNHGS